MVTDGLASVDDREGLAGDAPPSGPSVGPKPIWWVLGALAIVAVLLMAWPADDAVPEPSAVAPTTTGANEVTGTGAAAGDRRWPSEVQGRPAIFGQTKEAPPASAPDGAAGLYLWSDFDGWHLWYVRGAGEPELTGRVTSNADVEKADPENEAGVELVRESTEVSFTLGRNGQAVSGFNLNPGFFADRIVVTTDGATKIHLGRSPDARTSPVEIAKG